MRALPLAALSSIALIGITACSPTEDAADTSTALYEPPHPVISAGPIPEDLSDHPNGRILFLLAPDGQGGMAQFNGKEAKNEYCRLFPEEVICKEPSIPNIEIETERTQ